jgi:UDPglucose 6-dehydrogenase
MKSTVHPGTGVKLSSRLNGSGVEYVSNPEFLREGSAVNDWYRTDRIVLGGSEKAVSRAAALYADVEAPMLACDITSAEMIKYASNAFLATKISFINEIASLCDLVGAQIDFVAQGVGMDGRIGPAFLKPGIGYGGSCFPKDTRALDFLASFNGYDFHLLRGVIEVNARQRMMPVRALMEHIGDLDGKRVAVLGLTFKPDTDDTREAPAVDIISMLAAEGADVTGYNPVPTTLTGPFTVADSIDAAVKGADAVIVTTEWPEICNADWAALVPGMAPDVLIYDGRNCLSPDTIRSSGARYVGVGRPQIGA